MKKEILKFEKDETEGLDNLFENCRAKYFPNLIHAKINYIFRTSQKKDDEGMFVLGEAKKLSSKDRDIYGYDFEICIYKEAWNKANRKRKERIAWHELNHLIVLHSRIDEDEPRIDKAGRVLINIKPHDVIIKTFEEELIKFGPEDYQIDAVKSINKYLKQKKRKEKRR